MIKVHARNQTNWVAMVFAFVAIDFNSSFKNAHDKHPMYNWTSFLGMQNGPTVQRNSAMQWFLIICVIYNCYAGVKNKVNKTHELFRNGFSWMDLLLFILQMEANDTFDWALIFLLLCKWHQFVILNFQSGLKSRHEINPITLPSLQLVWQLWNSTLVNLYWSRTCSFSSPE